MCYKHLSPGFGTGQNPQDQIENKSPEIVCLLRYTSTEFLGYLKLTKVLQSLLIGHLDSKLLRRRSIWAFVYRNTPYDVSL